MNHHTTLLVFALTCVLCFPGLLLGGCANPGLPSDPVDLDNPDSPPPGGDLPDPPPDPPELSESTVEIDFESAVEGIVGDGFAGTGLASVAEPGKLDSDAWRITGFSDGDLQFGDEASTGDWARGISAGGVSIGGLYAFLVEPDNHGLGVQPTSTDFDPGSIVLKLEVPSDSVRECRIGYTLWTFNDQDRSTAWTVSFSPNDKDWTELPDLCGDTPAVADVAPQWSASECTAVVGLQDAALQRGQAFYLRWAAADGGGEGSRDECAIDDVSVTFTFER